MLLERFADLGVRLEAITGFLAVFVLILVLNWFMHNVYWTGWLANQHARKRQILSGSGVLWSGAEAELRTLVVEKGIPIYTTPQGRGVL
mgnify:CR=1 FL=1